MALCPHLRMVHWGSALLHRQTSLSHGSQRRMLQAAVLTQRERYSSDTQEKDFGTVALTSRELHRAALLARLSGLCYWPADQLADRLSAEGMQLVVQGKTFFTRWYVADGPLDRVERAARPLAASSTAQYGSSSLPGHDRHADGEQAPIERVVLMRGVVWRSEDVDSLKLWQELARFWPAPLAEDETDPKGILLSHAGVADLANQLYEPLRMPVVEGQALGRRINFGGHSLGGSLSLLLTVLYRLRLNIPPELIQCCTYGSPPVLSNARGTGGDGILQALGLPKGALRSFVLENDPIPRALLSVDPTFTAFKQSQPGSALLRLRQWLLGPGVPFTPDRFLADYMDTNLIKWSAEDGHKVIPLTPAEMEEQLRHVGGQGITGYFQSMLDHAHGSYSQDLNAAARQLERQGL